MKPSFKSILKMQHFSLRNTALGLFSCRLDSVEGGDLGQERFSRNHPRVGTAFVSRELSMEGVFWFCVRECPKVI
jgi:hypothetical protein